MLKSTQLKKEAKQAKQELQDFRIKTKDIIYNLAYPERRKLLSIVAADAQGRINGMTVPELLTIVNLTAGTNEKTYLTTSGKEVIFWAETRPSVNVSTL